MDQLAALGTGIFQSLRPTFKIYAEQLVNVLPSLQEPTEHRYGAEPRQRVDIYTTAKEQSAPVVIFVHGGGLSMGDKRQEMPAGAYQNLGTFFARHGFLTLVPNYRLVGPEDPSAVFPSGGRDLSLLLLWLSEQADTLNANLSRVFVIGNSAGAVHTCTLLYADAIASLSPPLADAESHPPPLPIDERRGVEIKAAALVGMPAEFSAAVGPRAETLERYFGGGKDVIEDRCPVGLVKKSRNQTELLLATAELDPQDEILTPMDHFVNALDSRTSPPNYTKLHIAGHNHISVPFGLSLGGKEEQWGLDLVDWLNSR